MLLITGVLTTLIIPEKTHVAAYPEEESEEEIGLDMDYIWTQLGNISNVTYEAYDTTDIPKGRSFGSKGGIYTVDNILEPEMMNNLSLKNVTTEQLQYINESRRHYSSIINVSDFSLTVNPVASSTYPYENPIPKKEMFPIAVKKIIKSFWTHKFTFSDAEIRPINMTKIFPIWGAFEEFIEIINFEFLNDKFSLLLGNVTYIPQNGSIPSPDEQYAQVFLLDDVSGVQEKLENITNASGVIIIDTGNPRIADASDCPCPAVLIYTSSGNAVKELLENYTVVVDNLRGFSKKLRFTYDPDELTRQPFFVIDRIPKYNEFLKFNQTPNIRHNLFYCCVLFLSKIGLLSVSPGFQTYLTCLQFKTNFLLNWNKQCKGIILYDSDDYHFMWSMNTQSMKISFVKPIICVNQSVGQYLRDNCDDFTLSGFVNQTYLEEKQGAPGAIGENIYGNITIDKSPSDMIAIVSNRYDGMFGQTSGDSAVGTAIVLGIAKFFKDHPSVKPKYNLTFLFTTAEEYGFHGARYHCDKHIDQKQKVKYWLMLDQLGFNQADCKLCIDYNDTSNTSYFDKILDQIREDSGYPEDKTIKRTGKEISSGSEQATVDKRFTDTTTIGLVKDHDGRWDQWHRAGNNYTEGDSIKNIDRDDVNATARLTLGLVKYFMINPDCWFNGSATYAVEDSPYDADDDNDSINVTVSVTSSLPQDRVRVNATVKSWPSNTIVFWKNFDFNITSGGTQKTLIVTLPPASTGATNGTYFITLNLLNSTGRINDIALNTRVYNDTDTQSGYVYLCPRNNSIPNKPRDITGPSEIPVGEPANYTTNTTDSNLDQLQYQWAWRRDLEYLWFLDTTETGPYDSGQNCTVEHTYCWCGEKKIQVRAREDFRYLFDGSPMGWDRYGTWSEWSDPHYVIIEFLTSFDMSCTVLSSAVNAQSATELPSVQQLDSIYEAIACGGTEPYNYTWTFNHERYEKQQKTVNYSFDESGNYSVVLNVSDSNDYSKEFSVNVSVVNLSASFNLSIPSLFTKIGENITFTDTSAVANGRNMTNWTWDFDDGTISYDQNVTHQFSEIGFYNVSLTVRDNLSNTDTSYRHILVFIDETPPEIGQVNNEINVKNRWLEVIILGIFNDTESGINHTKVNIIYPNGTHANYTMNHFINDTYGYVFNDTAQAGQYNYTIWVTDYENNTCNETGYSFVIPTSPMIVNVNASPQTVGFGGNITITTNVMDNGSGIDHVSINITYPNNSTVNLSMTHVLSETYSLFFNDTWQTGDYSYSIWAVDSMNNTDRVSGFNFTVFAEAAITVCTTKDSYIGNEFINLTDPPGDPAPSLGYELLNDGDVLHLWNQYDSYYFNTTSGIQLTNHKDEYWSRNVLMLGYYHNDQWNLLYRTDDLTGFNRDIEIDETSYVNVTLWKDLTYAGYSFRLAIRYHLGVNDNDLTIIPSIKNIGTTSIPYVLGFGWELKDIQINMTTQGDYILVDQDKYLLNQTLDNSYTSLNETVFYLMEDVTGSQTKSLYLRWNPDLTYKLLVKSRTGQTNAPVTLFIRVGTLAVGQQKHTLLRWYDASQETFYFNGFDENKAWESDPELMIDESEETYASTTTDTDVQLCNANTCPGDDQGTILKVELRVHGYYEGRTPGNITLRPVFRDGELTGENYTFVASDQPGWSDWFDITSDGGHGSGQWSTPWSWSEINTLDCDVKATLGSETTLFCSKVELRVTYNTAPVVSNPSPPYGVNGVGLQPWVNITISDPDGDSMNITWYSNSTPSLLTLRPNANGSSTELSKYPSSTPANYMCVDETVANDSDYVYWKGSSWKKDTYTLPNHTNQTGTINNITVYARCARVGSIQYPVTNSSAKIVIRINETYSYGSAFIPPYSAGPPVTYTNYAYTWTVNPVNGKSWTWTDIDNLQAGITFIGTQGTSRCSHLYVIVNYTNPNTWLQFGQNSSVSNGIYRQQFLNASVNGQWWYWKVKADDGTLSTWSSVYKFYTGYQSKIENTGETTIKGYLLMQVQYYNETSEEWMLDIEVVNQTMKKVINASEQLGLDQFFNGEVRTNDLTYGAGTYRVYAAFRDPKGNILNTSDETKLEAWWLFTKT